MSSAAHTDVRTGFISITPPNSRDLTIYINRDAAFSDPFLPRDIIAEIVTFAWQSVVSLLPTRRLTGYTDRARGRREHLNSAGGSWGTLAPLATVANNSLAPRATVT